MNDVIDNILDYEDQTKVINLRNQEQMEALDIFLQHKGGRSFIFDVLQECGISARVGSMGVEEANHLNGRRYIGQMIVDIIKQLSPEILTRIEVENE